MNGEIGLDSTPGQGSTFWLEWPAIEVRRKIIVPSDDEPVVMMSLGRSHQAILYIEDNQANLRLVQHVFNRLHNVKLYSAPNAEIGIEMARSKQPALILLDINLPGMDGYEALSRLRNIKETADIPVIAVSAAAMARDIERGLIAGFKRYITKPIQVTELLNIVREELTCEPNEAISKV